MIARAPQLRDYQDKSLGGVRQRLRHERRVILQAPTGAGKSVMIAHMIARAAEKERSSWLVCHRQELLDQLSGTLYEAGVDHGVIMSGRSQTKHPVQVASIQTLVRRIGSLPAPDLLAIDECHHATASSYLQVIAACPDSYVVGLTATPSRTDGRGLGDVFGGLVEGPSVKELIERGFLSPFRLIVPDQPLDVSSVRMRGGDFSRRDLEVTVDKRAIIGNAVDHYQDYVAPNSCLVYCVSRLHARHVTDGYRERGIDARYVCGDTPKAERDQVIVGFKAGRIPVIVSVDLFGEGLDCPGLTAVQLLRPTQSLGLHLQQIGRALRVERGKSHAIILDHVGNTWRHGLPDDEREWSLEGRKTQGKKNAGPEDMGPDIRHCEKCFSVFRAALACPNCGHEIKPKGRKIEEVAGELKEIDPEEHRRMRQIERKREISSAARDGLRGLVEFAIEQEYKPGWAARQMSFRKPGEDLHALKAQEIEIRAELRTERRATA